MKNSVTLIGTLIFENQNILSKFLKLFNFSTLQSIFLRNALTISVGNFQSEKQIIKVSFSDFDNDLGYDEELLFCNGKIKIIEKLREFPWKDFSTKENYGGIFSDYSFQNSEIFGELFSFKLGVQKCLKIMDSYVYPKLGDDQVFRVLNENKFTFFEDLLKTSIENSKRITDEIIFPQRNFDLFEVKAIFSLLDIIELME